MTDLLFLSHCVPNPPDKGEKIRAHAEITALSRHYRVHLACMARKSSELAFAQELRDRCASVHVQLLGSPLPMAALRFGAGGECLNTAYYTSTRMSHYVRNLCARSGIRSSVVYTLAMAQYVPPGMPFILDMVDVDSEKWFEYGRRRQPRFLYRIEAARLRNREIHAARRAATTFLAAFQETDLFRKVSGLDSVRCLENGVDFEYFDPTKVPVLSGLLNRELVVFVGTMDYYPNVDGAIWFASEVMPALRRIRPQLEFLIVGNHPSRVVRVLSRLPGVSVIGGVPDVRPYIVQADAVVAPLRMARGIQNKVLEALACGRAVLASTPVCNTFGGNLPVGVVRCDGVADFCSALAPERPETARYSAAIRDQARVRFSWASNLETLLSELDHLPPAPGCSL